MADPKREELRVVRKNAILVGVIDSTSKNSKEHALDELEGLAKTAGVHVVGKLVQFRRRPHIATCLGKGKLEELTLLADSTDAELILFDNNLTPAQGRNLEMETDRVIVDRSELILDIFATRAQTYEAKLQVELAQLLYFRPRLTRLWTHLERIEGGVGAGRGPGEKQLETDKRLLDKRVSELRRKLATVEKRRQQTVARRKGQLTVSTIGYTNAGKSTLMRALTGADVLVADKLFATLDTKTRRWHISKWGDVLLSDTVGFVRNLPHHLVASFRSTLEEARQADLLLHVVDATHPEAAQQIDTVDQVLSKIGISNENTILLLNKVDAADDYSIIDVLRLRYENSIAISAATRQGFDRLEQTIKERLSQGLVDAEIEADVANGRLFSYLAEHAEVTNTEFHESRVTFNCRIPHRFLASINGADTVVRLLEPVGAATADDDVKSVGEPG